MGRSFIIYKGQFSYEVILENKSIEVKPLSKDLYDSNMTIAVSLQTLGHAQLLINFTLDPIEHLKKFYKSKDWRIDEGEL